ncbi:MAG TPA: dihydroneopterin aldolase [Actinomycetota bacterium]|nr:dihydroneopterin aldolase [Actinomycetota bacterium]
MDAIVVEGLRGATRVGVTEEERARPQFVIIDVIVHADLSAPARTDELGDTIDYSTVTSTVAGVLAATEAKLLEHLAHHVAAAMLAFEGVEKVTVEVVKESPPIAEETRRVGVRIERDAG